MGYQKSAMLMVWCCIMLEIPDSAISSFSGGSECLVSDSAHCWTRFRMKRQAASGLCNAIRAHSTSKIVYCYSDPRIWSRCRPHGEGSKSFRDVRVRVCQRVQRVDRRDLWVSLDGSVDRCSHKKGVGDQCEDVESTY